MISSNNLRGPFLHHIPGVNMKRTSRWGFCRAMWTSFGAGDANSGWCCRIHYRDVFKMGVYRAMADVSWCFMGNMMRIHIGELAAPNQVFRKKNIGLSSHPPKICWLVSSHARSFQQDEKELRDVNHQKWWISFGEASWNWDIEPIYANILNTPNQFLGPHFFDHMEALQSTLALQASYAKRGKKQFINRSSNY